MPTRLSTHTIHPLFLQRWSPRAFDQSEIAETDLLTLIEAARWAPSAYNLQPWRFLYSLRNDVYWETFLGLLDPFNAGWAQNASALVFLISEHTRVTEDGNLRHSKTHNFDTGAAWAQLALQATESGYQAHAMAGIDFENARETLNVPDQFDVQIAIAIGKQASPHTLAEELRSREVPSDRLALGTIATAGVFPHE